LAHPTPTTKRCVLDTEDGRVFFDADTDTPPARDVPAEAHRRFRADLRAQRERNLKTRAEQLAQHEEKKRFAAEWITDHGTPEQQARQAAGVLPIEEAIDAMTDFVFRPFVNRPRYAADGVSRLQDALKGRFPAGSETTVTAADVVVSSTNAETMTAAQWAAINECRAVLPDATVVLRIHTVSWKKDRSIRVQCFGILVTQRFGPFTLRREFADKRVESALVDCCLAEPSGV
jgi:hypothetical protein